MTSRPGALGLVGLALGTGTAATLVVALVVAGRDLSTATTILVIVGAGGAGSLGLAIWNVGRSQSGRLLEAAGEVRRLGRELGSERTERSRLESVLAAMTDGILVTDSAGVIRLANDAALSILGAPPGEAKGKRLIELTRDNDIYELAMGAAAQNRVGLREIELVADRRHISVLALPVPSIAGRQTEGRAVLVVKDITDLHRLEVTRREFISNASHELRTPVAAIKASAETLQAGAVDEPEAREEFLGHIVQDADRMDRMLNELLDLARLESGQTPLHMAPVDLAAFEREIVSRFQPIADARRVSMSWRVKGPVPQLTADVERLHQLVGNLVSNAIKVTPEGGSIGIEGERTESGVEIRVTDTGTGIDPEHIPHIFERFYRADRARGGSGVGLGLAIAKHIAMVHGGEITVRSRPGEGSTFQVRLPAAVGFEEETARSE